jgi:hypothetical protein
MFPACAGDGGGARHEPLLEPSSIGHYLFMVLRNRLAKMFEPPKINLPRR